MSATRSVLITGGNSGLGEQAALNLARMGWQVVLACRTVSTGNTAAGRIRAAVPGALVSVIPLDLSDLKSVVALTDGWASQPFAPLHGIVANAGIQHATPDVRTAQGIEDTFGVNVLAHLLLIERLEPLMTAPGRVVWVGSGTHDPEQSGGFPPPYDASAAALAFPDDFLQAFEAPRRAATRRYSSSKLAVNQVAFHLAGLWRSRGRDITINVFDPGLMLDTQLSRSYPAALQQLTRALAPLLARLLPRFLSTAPRSGAHLAALVSDETLAGQTGLYFVQGGRGVLPLKGEASALSRDGVKSRLMYEESLALIGRPDGQAAKPLDKP